MFDRAGLHMIVGPHGAGKTLLGRQLATTMAKGGDTNALHNDGFEPRP